MYISFSIFYSLDDTPTKQQLIQLDVPDLGVSIRIKDGIGDYDTLGVFLLHDDTGIILHRIKNDFKRSSEILDELFNRWIRGEGQVGRERSNTWRMLIKYLQIAKLLVLAEEIESVLQYCAEKSLKSDKNCLENHVSGRDATVFYLACCLTLVLIIATTYYIIFRFCNKSKIMFKSLECIQINKGIHGNMFNLIVLPLHVHVCSIIGESDGECVCVRVLQPQLHDPGPII